ncbi:MAG: hypothetical protein QF464_09405, partial [Myxococcota bacterium]|nr:hypothetical protein [Myxococcota bacterium]
MNWRHLVGFCSLALLALTGCESADGLNVGDDSGTAYPDISFGDISGGDIGQGAGEVIEDPGTVSCQSNSDCDNANIGVPDPCMLLSCDVDAGTCTLRPADDGAECDDGNACTVGNVCAGGLCGQG